MKALSGNASLTVSSSPSITTTQFSNPIFNFSYSYRKPNSLSPSLIQFTKPKFMATVLITETVEQDEKFDWFSHWYAIMAVCDLDKRAPHGKRGCCGVVG
ncbi:hypothetical protein Hanom_Chr15g01399671 [Helianthus anomalus]